ncbi:T9SS type A sorting domain-containing protein [Gaetbulibacter jejuensis]|uniref:Secretion system C-terminal sorting domain-containing protein n=1 Tax=Gaetbulibacter jejuensis TaxID=584607 RepID=A0ABN1JYD2_9FLAO
MKPTVFFLFFSLSFSFFGQNSISGTVYDTEGVLPFANVIVKHTSKGVIADENGKFTIEAKPTDTLQVSFLGYTPKDVHLQNIKDLDVVLDGYESLDEVVVIAFDSYSVTHILRCGIGVDMIYEYICEEAKGIEPKIYPNPSSTGVFNFVSQKDYQTVEILIHDFSGRQIQKLQWSNFNRKGQIDLSGYQSGIYLVNIKADGTWLETKKIIKG